MINAPPRYCGNLGSIFGAEYVYWLRFCVIFRSSSKEISSQETCIKIADGCFFQILPSSPLTAILIVGRVLFTGTEKVFTKLTNKKKVSDDQIFMQSLEPLYRKFHHRHDIKKVSISVVGWNVDTPAQSVQSIKMFLLMFSEFFLMILLNGRIVQSSYK